LPPNGALRLIFHNILQKYFDYIQGNDFFI